MNSLTFKRFVWAMLTMFATSHHLTIVNPFNRSITRYRTDNKYWATLHVDHYEMRSGINSYETLTP